MSEPVNRQVFRLTIGRTTIGRDEDCDVVLNDMTVSMRHAEVVLRPEGCTVSNLMATNGTRVNDYEVQSAELNDGDVLRFGKVSVVFKNVSAAHLETSLLHRVRWVMLAGSLALVGVIVMLLLN